MQLGFVLPQRLHGNTSRIAVGHHIPKGTRQVREDGEGSFAHPLLHTRHQHFSRRVVPLRKSSMFGEKEQRTNLWVSFLDSEKKNVELKNRPAFWIPFYGLLELQLGHSRAVLRFMFVLVVTIVLGLGLE